MQSHPIAINSRRQLKNGASALKSPNGSQLAKLLPPETIHSLLKDLEYESNETIFLPYVTTSIFLTQALSQDKSCSNALLANIDWKKGHDNQTSDHTGSYCKARARLPEEFYRRLAIDSGKQLEEDVAKQWRWKGRKVKIVDGSTISMPDSAKNQTAYPQQRKQQNGVGFPLARIAVVISLQTGAIEDLAIGPWRGKGTGEHALCRQMLETFEKGDVVLGDAYYPSYHLIWALRQKGCDVLFCHDGKRTVDFCRGKRLGKNDHIVEWRKSYTRPEWISKQDWESLPKTMFLRETKVTIVQKGFRSRSLVLVTTMLDAEKCSLEELAQLYKTRWQAELNLRSIKDILHMDILRCKSPEMVRKELWVHVLAYNLIRSIMAQCASSRAIELAKVSFKATLQAFNSLRSALFYLDSSEEKEKAYSCLIDVLSRHKTCP